MSEIMQVRRFEEAIGADYLHQAMEALGWCRKLYGVSPGIHFLAMDGRQSACIFDAPDAEAVRSVIRAGGRSEPEAVWACTVHPGPDDDGASLPLERDSTGTLVVIERSFERPSHPDELQADAPLPDDRGGVRYVRSYLSNDRLRAISLYAAPDLELVREAYRLAGLRFHRIWPARAIDGAPGKGGAVPQTEKPNKEPKNV
jgi:hypothetical protein